MGESAEMVTRSWRISFLAVGNSLNHILHLGRSNYDLKTGDIVRNGIAFLCGRENTHMHAHTCICTHTHSLTSEASFDALERMTKNSFLKTCLAAKCSSYNSSDHYLAKVCFFSLFQK